MEGGCLIEVGLNLNVLFALILLFYDVYMLQFIEHFMCFMVLLKHGMPALNLFRESEAQFVSLKPKQRTGYNIHSLWLYSRHYQSMEIDHPVNQPIYQLQLMAISLLMLIDIDLSMIYQQSQNFVP